ncbi:MAG: hypothetical protein IKB96_05610 [Prevotella sp.]|nr:hypothetical protein [Prevotella sp.]
MSEYIVELDSKHCIALNLALAEEMRGGDFIRGEIVRCRDCVAYEPYHTYAGMKLDYGECMQHRRQTNDDRFCWWAERSDR